MDTIDFDLPCASCDYNLRGLSAAQLKCPECGLANLAPGPVPQFSDADVRRKYDEAEVELLILLGVTAVMVFGVAPFLFTRIVALRAQQPTSGDDFGHVLCAGFVFPVVGFWWIATWRSWARRSRPGSAWARCVVSYAALLLLGAMSLFALAFAPHVLWTWTAYSSPFRACGLSVAGVAFEIIVLYVWIRPRVLRLRERLLETQREGLIAELRDAALRNPTPTPLD